ncbi:TRAP transporter small permease [Bordetella bronchiseptica]|uniref:TRAP transporter small permease n=1 Tax=Bordetella bronchiseptica TaxID=518 RepID=UPI000461BFD8|nr:TRAP transporter small permease [Bordetella bronchiseptica]KDD17846.1 TRAP transporter, DctQ-like membrane protein [Bordetella bronchiseptica MBORD707]
MNTPQSPARPDGLPLVSGLMRVQRLLSELIVLAMTLLIAAEVVCRALFGFSLLIVEEVGGYLLVALVFLGMGVALHDGVLFRAEFVINALGERARLVLQCVFDAVCLAGMAMLSWQLGVQVYESYVRGVRAATTLATPLYLPQLFMVAGALSTALVLLSQLLEGMTRLRSLHHE